MVNPFEIQIKKAESADIDTLFEIEKESIGLWTKKQFFDELNCSFAIFLTAAVNTVPAGYIAAWKVADEIQINSIAVKAGFRGHGIGRKLIDEAIKFCSKNGPEKIILEVSEKNITALKFYKKYGFTEIGVRKNFYINENALIMEKIL